MLFKVLFWLLFKVLSWLLFWTLGVMYFWSSFLTTYKCGLPFEEPIHSPPWRALSHLGLDLACLRKQQGSPKRCKPGPLRPRDKTSQTAVGTFLVLGRQFIMCTSNIIWFASYLPLLKAVTLFKGVKLHDFRVNTQKFNIRFILYQTQFDMQLRLPMEKT